jgi:hypothetical protein
MRLRAWFDAPRARARRRRSRVLARAFRSARDVALAVAPRRARMAPVCAHAPRRGAASFPHIAQNQ